MIGIDTTFLIDLEIADSPRHQAALKLFKKWLGEIVGKEGDDLSRHDKWLCMMYPRLRLLHKLLSPNGAIFLT